MQSLNSDHFSETLYPVLMPELWISLGPVPSLPASTSIASDFLSGLLQSAARCLGMLCTTPCFDAKECSSSRILDLAGSGGSQMPAADASAEPKEMNGKGCDKSPLSYAAPMEILSSAGTSLWLRLKAFTSRVSCASPRERESTRTPRLAPALRLML
jgi:hypothetical protein